MVNSKNAFDIAGYLRFVSRLIIESIRGLRMKVFKTLKETLKKHKPTSVMGYVRLAATLFFVGFHLHAFAAPDVSLPTMDVAGIDTANDLSLIHI